MSSDARVRWQSDGDLRGSHDGFCHRLHSPHPRVVTRYELHHLIRSIEECMGQPLAWEIREGGDEGYWLAGYCAR